jgi:FlaA1/EpsC-like NDP-sugar epimerase
MSEETSRLGFVFTHRRPVVIGIHWLLWAASFLGAFYVRFEFALPGEYVPNIWLWLGMLLALRSAAAYWFGAFHGLWRYSGLRDLLTLFKMATASTVAFILLIVFADFRGFPRSIFIIDWLGTIMLVGGFRFGVRTIREFASQAHVAGDKQKILIIGAGNAGEMLLREIHKSHAARFIAVGFLDDDERKIGERIHGVRVFGPIASAPVVAKSEEIDEIIIAIPTATGREMRRILAQCKPAGVPIRTIPSMDSLIDGRVSLSQIRAVAIDDLLGREPVQLDTVAVAEFVRGQRVMVTGAGGSIGSELCRQVARFGPSRLTLVERSENALFLIHRELLASFPAVVIEPRLADINDRRRLSDIFEEDAPTVVFHAAAHKHVPMMEWNPGEAVKNNTLGTRLVADLSVAHDVRHFVMVSTDKAVNPTSVMGASKRAAEIYVQARSQRSSTRFITVRFGNVLGSAGSVIPIFQQQIARGGPVTVTHPDMKRFFMTIAEASQLILQAATMGQGGEIFILDMGEPVRIVDLARDLITLSGLEPDNDVEIQFTGIRPGEKLFEELSTTEEHADKTRHPKIFVGKLEPHELASVNRQLDALAAAADSGDPAAVLAELASVVVEYRPPAPVAAAPVTAGAAVIPLR